MRFELGLDHQIDMAGGEHAIGVAIAAVARQPHRLLNPGKRATVGIVHQQRTCGQQHRILQARAGPRAQGAVARGAAVVRRAAVAGEMLPGERLVHHPVDRLAAAGQRNERAPGRHAADEGLGAVDRIKHPDIFRLRTFGSEFLAYDAVFGERLHDQGAHRRLRGAVGGRDRIEAAGQTLVLHAKRGAKERPDGFTGDGSQLVHEGHKIDRRHRAPSLVGGLLEDNLACCRLDTIAYEIELANLRVRFHFVSIARLLGTAQNC